MVIYEDMKYNNKIYTFWIAYQENINSLTNNNIIDTIKKNNYL